MISHVFIGVNHFRQAFSFYSAVLDILGLRLKFHDAEKPWAGWMPADQARPLLIIGAPNNGATASPGNGQMIALSAATRQAVDRCYAIALENGGQCEGAPGLRAHYHPDYYGAYFRDPDGNKLCVCCHEAEEPPD